jgi:asparagine synthase (glutamine-hydrolysing)
MCGIAGILRVTPPGSEGGGEGASGWRGVDGIPESWLDLLDAAIAHRGPDGCGRFRDSVVRADGARVEVALVHRRLSIIDIAGGAQPMVSERGKPLKGEAGQVRHEGLVAVVFNGCIYNHRELRAELEKAGRVFVTGHSDTEVLIHDWRDWIERVQNDEIGLADGVIERLDAMCAAAVWDRCRAVLSLVRDRSGEKPLYRRDLDAHGSFAFCSVAGALSELFCGRGLSINAPALADWMAMGWSHFETPIGGVRQLRPGENGWPKDPNASGWTVLGSGCPCAVVLLACGAGFLYLFYAAFGIWIAAGCAGLVAITVAWDEWRESARTPPLDVLDKELHDAVTRRLEADVLLGCFLSGGIDSSLIAHYAKQARPDLATLCMRMPDARYDESKHAEAVARHLGTNHITLDVQTSAAEDVVHLIGQLGLPFGDSSLLPTYWLCRAARQHVKVALSGDGGDELFMGYQRHAAAKWLPWLRAVAWAWPVSGGRYDESDPTSRDAKMARLIRAARGKGYTDLLAIFPSELRRKVFRARGIECERSRFLGRGQARRFDIEHYLPGDLLRKTDTASMSVGLEVRCPFLDQEVQAFAYGTPIRTLMRGNKPKALLRELAARHLPAEIVNRPKQGFAIPIGEWFRTDFGGLRTLLMDVLGSREPFGVAGEALGVDMDGVRGMVDEHMSGRRDHGQRLYALMVLGVWARQSSKKQHSSKAANKCESGKVHVDGPGD